MNIKVYPKLATDRVNKQGEQHAQIWVLLNGRLIKRINSHIYIHPDRWDEQHREATGKHASAINTRLSNLTDEIKGKLYKLQAFTENVSKEAVLAVLEGGKANSVVAFFDKFIDSLRTPDKKGETSNKNTIKKWVSERNRLNDYNPDVTFGEIDVDWMERYQAHCGKDLNAKTSLPVTMRKLKEILRKADSKGLYDISKIKGYKRPTYKDPDRPYLTLAQTDTISELIYSGKLDFDEARRLAACFFLVECWAGIRFSDWGKFRIEKLIDSHGLKVRTTKTNTPIYAPLDNSPRLKKILDYITDNGLVFDLTEQHTNRLLKDIGKSMKLPFALTTHVGRHTNAVLLLDLGYSYEYVAEFLGVSLRTAMIYGKITRVRLNREYEKLGGL